MKSASIIVILVISFALPVCAESLSYPIVDTSQVRCYSSSSEIEYPKPGQTYFGQDAHYAGNQPAYRDNGDGTVTDLVTGLMWQQSPGAKKTYAQALAGAKRCNTAGHTDWRLPTIKELYSLILFTGTDPDPTTTNTSGQKPFIDNKYFKFKYGSSSDGDRIIDSQYATSTIYRSTTMGGNKTMFGVNFADGRIKGYPVESPRGAKKFYVMYVRGNKDYGKNNFKDNGDGTVTDTATSLTWMKIDSAKLKAKKMNWAQALKWAEELDYAGHSDWRLPNAKELQSIVDYTRCPDITKSPAIDPIFDLSVIKNEGSKADFAHYWTSTTHAGSTRASQAAYISFGRALGFMTDRRTGSKQLMDVHGAGAQRSDPKSGNPSQFSTGRGPQGDVVRIYNYVLCVRDGQAQPNTKGPKVKKSNTSRSQRAPQRQTGPSRPDFVSRHDRNNDGKVSRSEFPGPDDHFKQFDKNNDGYLTNDEAPKGPPQQRQR